MSDFFKENKYIKHTGVKLDNRVWPTKLIEKAPIWCSVDLRDGNQALVNPMNFKQKLSMYNLLVEIGFKQIEIGFPSAAQVEYDFARYLIENNLIPDDVIPQTLTQAREHLVRKTFDSLKGSKKAILHIYNSTSELQRRIVFKKNKSEIKDIAVKGVQLVKELAKETDTEITLEYSPESFTGTELEYSLEVCEAVMEVWEPSIDNKIILNLPATVEMTTPNIHADQIEWFCKNLKERDKAIISLHPHNDRGTAVAAAELGLLAGADRIEGTLFGNGERTGNVDLTTIAANLFTQGIKPELDLSDISTVREEYEKCTGMTVHERHPYAGDLVFTAFSGSHQDAIKKGMAEQRKDNKELWEVPYLPIDPSDIGRDYKAIIRINSQSGKGGVAYIMEDEFGFHLPKSMHPEFSQVIQKISDKLETEVPVKEILGAFEEEYLDRKDIYQFVDYKLQAIDEDNVESTLSLIYKDKEITISSKGNGPIDAAKKAIIDHGLIDFSLLDYYQHALSSGSESEAIAYIQIKNKKNNKSCFGVGIDPNTNKASIKALISAVNRLAQ
ncbi:UNVERIFIED_CONTAM: hypothetical protein GTU68_041334 [Idotea baltica]|nr:hypothetical protein [Idotea baltica]